MQQTEKHEVADLIKRAGGLKATHRKSGVALETLRTGVRGMRRWSPDTRAKLARAWGVEAQTIRWPTTEVAVPDVEETRLRYRAGEFEGDMREDEALRAEIEALVERQRWLSREQKEIAEKLAMFAERQPAAQEKEEK